MSPVQGLPGWDLALLQTSPGAFSGESTSVSLDGLQLARQSFTGVLGQACGAEPPASYRFRIPVSMSGDGRSDLGMCNQGPGVTPPVDIVTVMLPQQTLMAYMQHTEQLDIAQGLARSWLLREDCQLARDLSVQICEAISACRSDEVDASQPALRRALTHRILEAIGPVIVAQLQAPEPAFEAFSRSVVVRKAREFVLDRIAQPLQIIDICRGLGVSRRLLQASFQQVLGVSLLSYLRLVSLNGARQALLQARPGALLRDVTAPWGFWHLGRFGAEYREMFGELPAETLRRASGAESKARRSAGALARDA